MQPEMDPDAVARERARRRQRAEQVQRRRLALGVVALGLVVLVVALAIGLSGGEDEVTTTTAATDGALASATFSAELTGDDSVPPVQTAATGNLILTYDAETNEMSFVLEITHVLSNPTGATIYEGAPGTEDGAAVYTLYVADQAEEGTFSGILAEGVISEADLIGGRTFADLIKLIEDGNAYVSVANKTHPVDAIRGPIN